MVTILLKMMVPTSRPKTCALEDRENPDWPEGYTYLDRFLDEMKKQNNGSCCFCGYQ